jgi:hypothetical protein
VFDGTGAFDRKRVVSELRGKKLNIKCYRCGGELFENTAVRYSVDETGENGFLDECLSCSYVGAEE